MSNYEILKKVYKEFSIDLKGATEQSKQAFVIPVPQGGEDENTYISRCISDIIGEYDQEGQAYAICKGKWDEPK
jgi:hypothetical protein